MDTETKPTTARPFDADRLRRQMPGCSVEVSKVADVPELAGAFGPDPLAAADILAWDALVFVVPKTGACETIRVMVPIHPEQEHADVLRTIRDSIATSVLGAVRTEHAAGAAP